MDDLLTRLVELEAEVAYKTSPGPGEMDFRYAPGTIPFLLSAPHGAAHQRNGRLKDEDEYTAGLARLVAERTGAHALYTWRRSASDPNYDCDSPYKAALKDIVHNNQVSFIMDLHGCASSRDFGVAIGSMRGASCPVQLSAILEIFAQAGYHPQGRGLFRLDLDRAFPGGGGPRQETITRYAVNILGVPALQVELNASLRIVRSQPGASQTNPKTSDHEHIRRIIAVLETIVRAVVQTDGRVRPGSALN